MKEILHIINETLKIMLFTIKPIIDQMQEHPYFKVIALPGTILGIFGIITALSKTKCKK